MIKYKMRAPGDGALPLEAMAWDGDSGGPAFIEVDGDLHIAGVNSYGDCCSYGDFDYYTRLGGAAYEWIQEVLDGNHDFQPNCSAYGNYGLDINPDLAAEIFGEYANANDELTMKNCIKLYRDNADDMKKNKEIKQYCKKFDADKDNMIDFAEFEKLIVNDDSGDGPDGPDDSECGQFFSKYNTKGKDLVWKEWYKMYRMECEDCDGMSKREIKNEAKSIRNEFDEDNNRRLSWEEFQEICEDLGISTS